jgi:hypothetical protein
MKNHRRVSRWVVRLTTAFIAAFFSVLVLTNTFGLRTILFLDTKIHTWSNIQNGQVVQRANKGESFLQLSGRVGLLAKSVEVGIVTPDMKIIQPKNWIPLDPSPRFSYFEGKISTFPGWIKVFGRSQGTNYRIDNGIQVGVGEVFIVAGQSNAAGSSKSLFISKSEKVRSGQLQEDGSILWKHGDDPQIRGGGGSPWPLVGDMLAKKLGVPIGFINVAVGGSSIRDWKPGSENFRQLIRAIEASNPYGVRAILWHQGESDQRMTSDEYYTRLVTVIRETQRASKSEIPIPWLVARATYAAGKVSEAVREAQKRIWDDDIALEGPDTDSLDTPYRETLDGVHFNEIGTYNAAKLWFQKINDAFLKNS